MSFLSNLFKSQSAVEQISASALKELLNQKGELRLIDVRTPQEFKEGHLPKAININVFSTNFVNECQSKLKTTDVLVLYCRSGQRSMNAAKKLEESGFKSLYNLKGGIMAWSKA